MLEMRRRTITYRAPEVSENAEETNEEIISEEYWAEEFNISLEPVLVREEPAICNVEVSEDCDMDLEMTNDPEFMHNEESSVTNKNEETARTTPSHSKGKVATTSNTDSSSVTENVRNTEPLYLSPFHLDVLCMYLNAISGNSKDYID